MSSPAPNATGLSQPADRSDRPVATVGMTTATALAVADMIGIGVFTSLGFQVKDLPSGFVLLALWVIGGVVALCGALSYAELAAALPRAGGEYNFLNRIYGRAVGFMAGWISATVGFAAPAALAAMAFGKYLDGVAPGISPLIAALALIWTTTFIHLRGSQQASAFQDIMTFLKVALIVIFIIVGFAYGQPQPISFAPTYDDLGLIFSGPFAIALVFVMYSYAGWNAATYIAHEVRNPSRVLPLSIGASVLIVSLLYVGLNAVFLYTTPVAKLAGQLDVGLIAGRQIFGEFGGRITGGIICLGLVSAVSAMMWIGPRVAMAMGDDHPALQILAKRTPDGVPAIATVLQAGIASGLLLTGSFEAVLDFIQFGLTVCSFLTVAGLLILRHQAPDLPRPYRVLGEPVTAGHLPGRHHLHAGLSDQGAPISGARWRHPGDRRLRHWCNRRSPSVTKT